MAIQKSETNETQHQLTEIEDEDESAEESVQEGIAPWVLTFADLITNLMVFFVMLFAMSTIEDTKWKMLKASLKSALGEITPEMMQLDAIKSISDKKAVVGMDEVGGMVTKEIEDISSEVEEFVYKNKLSGQVQVASDERGAVITVSDVVLFEAGHAMVNPAGEDILKKIFDLLKQFNYDVKVEGHTDNVPIQTEQYPSNWELSAGRAASVARMLVAAGFPPGKLSVEGFAEYRPKATNDSPGNRSVNRRIEIVYQRASIKKRMVDILVSEQSIK